MNDPRLLVTRLRKRELVGEIMDDPALAEAEHERALAGLARINALSMTSLQLGRAIRRATRAQTGRSLRVIDLACGRGEVTLGLAGFSRQHQLNWELAGCDLSERSVQWARERTHQRGLAVNFFQADAMTLDLSTYDVVVSSLFLHHLTDTAVEQLLARLRVTRHVFISDLRRGVLAYGLTWLGCRVLSRSRVVHEDGPLSVRAAFTPSELFASAQAAGLKGAQVRRSFPLRMLLSWSAS